MQKTFKNLGNYWEERAVHFLTSHNYNIIATRYKVLGGEIDIIALKENKICFIEVKYRNNIKDYEGLVTEKKLNHINLCATKFLQKNPQYSSFVLSFELLFITKTNLEHILI